MASESGRVQRAALESYKQFADSDGGLDRSKLKCAWLAATGSRCGKAQLDTLLKGGEHVGYQAFATAVQEYMQTQDPDEHVRQVFKAFDLRGAGFLTRGDTHAVFKNAAPTVTSHVVDEVFDELDAHSGRVGCRDFINMMRTPGMR